MKLINGTLRPGEVLEILENGKIKASAPGLFLEEDKDNLPPIMPFFEICGSHSNAFSSPNVGDEVWILNMADNPLQLYWFRKDDHVTNNAEVFNEANELASKAGRPSPTENVEILCNREAGVGWATIYFSDGSGWVIKNNESAIQIWPDGMIQIGLNNAKNRSIFVDQGGVFLGGSGPDGKYEPAVLGNALVDVLNGICKCLGEIQTKSMMVPFTMGIGAALTAAGVNTLPLKISSILSSDVQLT
jgi:hypothetical protein